MLITPRSRLSQSSPRLQQLLVKSFTASSHIHIVPNRHLRKLCSISPRLASPFLRLPAEPRRFPAARPPRHQIYRSLDDVYGGIPAPKRQFFTVTTRRTKQDDMSSDQDYAAFLDKANEDPAKGVAASGAGKKKRVEFRTTEEGVTVPAVLIRVCSRGAFYVSDADEPFKPVALGWDEAGKGLPDEEEFAGLIGHWDPKNAEVEITDPVDWNRDGKYAEVVDAVREAGQGNDVRVYRIAREGVQAEYWVVTTEGKGKGAKLVGVKALSVES